MCAASKTLSSAELLAEYDAVVAKVEGAIARAQSSASDQLSCRPGCDSCCTAGLSVLPVEAAAVRRALPVARDFRARGEGWCAFLDLDGRCGVYAARPLLCRTHGLPLKMSGASADRGSLRVVDDDVSVCSLNFTQRTPTAAETLDAEAVLKLLVVVDRRFRLASGAADDASRVLLSTLVGP